MAEGQVGLVLGFEPFAGLPTNPAEAVLAELDGMTADGITVVARPMPVSLARLPDHLEAAVAAYRPVFLLGLGLAAGSSLIRAETVAINLAHFSVADNDGARAESVRFAADGPDARIASWDAGAVVAAILDEGIPARVSHHAGMHCCNLALFTALALVERSRRRVPCGFLHLPYLPEQVIWLMRRGNAAGPADPPSMALDGQLRAIRAAIRNLAAQVRAAHPAEVVVRDV